MCIDNGFEPSHTPIIFNSSLVQVDFWVCLTFFGLGGTCLTALEKVLSENKPRHMEHGGIGAVQSSQTDKVLQHCLEYTSSTSH